MSTTNYISTFIAVAEDCPVLTGEVPVEKAGKPTIASLQYDMIRKHPYKYDSDTVIFNVYASKNELTKAEMGKEREKFFLKGQACLRASPLTKRYGWGVHSNEHGQVAIYPVESAEYASLLKDHKLQQLKAMRTNKKKG